MVRALKRQSDHLLTKENTQAQAHHPLPPLPSRAFAKVPHNLVYITPRTMGEVGPTRSFIYF